MKDPVEHFEHDPDDLPPKESPYDIWWGLMNRWAEETMRYARYLGLV